MSGLGSAPPSALPGISPSRGEIDQWRRSRPNQRRVLSNRQSIEAAVALHPISPLEGEMPGRAEGGGRPVCHSIKPRTAAEGRG